MTRSVDRDSEKLLKSWTNLYFLNELKPFEKRLLDWWISEGFFCVTNFREGEKGTQADLMLMLGKSIYHVLGNSSEEDTKMTGFAVTGKIASGWGLLDSRVDGYYLIEDTADNRKRIENLLEENIRFFDIVSYNDAEIENGVHYLKSVTVEIHKRG